MCRWRLCNCIKKTRLYQKSNLNSFGTACFNESFLNIRNEFKNQSFCSLTKTRFTMTFDSYIAYHKSIVDQTPETLPPPYNNPDYYDYTKLNFARTSRWLKTGIISESLKQTIGQIKTPQQWIVITEPWCGDAAHSVPFFHLISQLNPLITVDYELRDSEPHRINHYLTRGGKSIPKLIVRNEKGNDLATWGPRPEECQKVYDILTERKADFETLKTELQNWYNANKGVDIQQELEGILKS